ncbi:hypothetical protein [Vreelandella rituensis]|nr:hypothetical protein [Halomonas rituensis]
MIIGVFAGLAWDMSFLIERGARQHDLAVAGGMFCGQGERGILR